LSADLRLTSTPQEHDQHKDVADWPDNEGDPLYSDEQVRWPVHSRRRPSWSRRSSWVPDIRLFRTVLACWRKLISEIHLSNHTSRLFPVSRQKAFVLRRERYIFTFWQLSSPIDSIVLSVMVVTCQAVSYSGIATIDFVEFSFAAHPSGPVGLFAAFYSSVNGWNNVQQNNYRANQLRSCQLLLNCTQNRIIQVL